MDSLWISRAFYSWDLDSFHGIHSSWIDSSDSFHGFMADSWIYEQFMNYSWRAQKVRHTDYGSEYWQKFKKKNPESRQNLQFQDEKGLRKSLVSLPELSIRGFICFGCATPSQNSIYYHFLNLMNPWIRFMEKARFISWIRGAAPIHESPIHGPIHGELPIHHERFIWIESSGVFWL